MIFYPLDNNAASPKLTQARIKVPQRIDFIFIFRRIGIKNIMSKL
jgi:hypothetical protein